MTTLQELHTKTHETWEVLAQARDAHGAAARRYLIAELLKILTETPEIVALELSTAYGYDDEGGYLLCLSESVVLADDARDNQNLDDYWTDGLDVAQEAILELFRIEGVGEGSLTREQLYSLAAQESIPYPTATDTPTATAPQHRQRDRAGQTTANDTAKGGQ